MKCTLRMELLSDACIGSGESTNGIVDLEVHLDEYGIPFIPAKRIKGILREEANELAHMRDIKCEVIDKIFGKVGDEKNGSLKLGNGQLEGKSGFVSKLKSKQSGDDYKDILGPMSIADMFTTTRTQTAIDENGIAKKDSLRVLRVIRRGERFEFSVDISDDTDFEFFDAVVQCVRHIGTGRNRGLGWVSCKLIKNNEVKVLDTELPDIICDRIFYKIELITDAILEKNYIAGNTVLGMVAGEYLRQNKLVNAHENELFSEIFLKNRVFFSDAYPYVEGKIAYPTPQCFKFDKGNTDIVYNIYGEVAPDKQYVRLDFEFCLIKKESWEEETYITPIRVNNHESLHHHRDPDAAVGCAGNRDSGDFFEYQSVSAETVFAGEISGERCHLNELARLLHGKEGCIGKSRSTQYGHCKITISNSIIAKPEADDNYNDEEVPILLLSDAVIYNKAGNPSLCLSDFLCALKRQLKNERVAEVNSLKIDENKTMIVKTYVDGFNTKWKLPKAVECAFAKGSVITVAGSAAECAELKSKLEGLHIGQYTGSGLGRMCMAPVAVAEDNRLLRVLKYIPQKASKVSDESEAWERILCKKAYEEIKHELLKAEHGINERYFKSIYENLTKKSSKSLVQFLLEVFTQAKRFADIEEHFSHSIEKENRANLANKPYTDLMLLLKGLNDDKGKFGEVPLASCVIAPLSSLIGIARGKYAMIWNREYLSKEGETQAGCANSKTFLLYRMVIIQLCKKAKWERRGNA